MKKLKKHLGFTLGEILIALTVIGIVAVLLLPQLVLGQKAARAKAQVNSAYSLLSKAITDMESNNTTVDPASYSSGTKSIYSELKNVLKISVDCGNHTAYSNPQNPQICNIDSTYKTKSSKSISTSLFDDGSFILKNGMLVATEDGGEDHGVLISVDINGKNKPPNKLGWDVFTFELTTNDLLPAGAPGTTDETNRSKYCSDTGTDNINGLTCAYYAIYDEEYFKNIYKGH